MEFKQLDRGGEVLLVPKAGKQLVPVSAELELCDAPWVIRSFHLHEGLGIPFELNIKVSTTQLDVRANDVLDQKAGFAFGRTEYRQFQGVVEQVVEAGVDDDVRRFELKIVHPLALLKYTINSQIFTHLYPRDILSKFIPSLKSKLVNAYFMRDYCVQYRESNLDFIHRLMEEEGITYKFEDDSVVLCDGISTYSVVHEPLKIVATDLDEEALTKLDQQFNHRSEGSHVIAFNWRAPDTLDVSSNDNGEVYYHDARRHITDTDDNLPFDKVQSETWATEQRLTRLYAATRWVAGSNVTTLSPGSMFHVDAPDDEVRDDLQLTITEIWHNATFPGTERGGQVEQVPEYSNLFCATLVPFRRTYGLVRPTIAGPQTAIVVGPPNEEIHTDPHGRIMIRFHWERTPAGEPWGWWVRVKQGWAGPGWGSFFLPRIGMEVVVEFLNGNPDEPLVTGCVYNSKNLVPYELPKDKTKSTIRSESSPGGNGFNELRFEDAAGNEEVFLHAQKTMTEVVKGSRSLSVGGGRSASVGGSDSRTVSGTQSLTVKKDRVKTVEGTETISVVGERKTTLSADDTLGTTGKTTRMLDGGLETIVQGNEKRVVDAKHELQVTGEHIVTVTGKSSLNVTDTHDATAMTRYAMAQAMVGKVVLEAGNVSAWGNASCVVSAGPDGGPTAVVSCTADGKVMIEAQAEISLKCGETTITLAADGTITVIGPQKLSLMGADATVVLSATGAEISGAEIKSIANGEHTIAGAVVNIN